jgi:mannan endo-1,4-beta-mannosidase
VLSPDAADANSPGAGFVRARGGGLELNGKAWLPRGLNSYPLLQHVGSGWLDALHEILARAVELGRPLIRTLAFMDSGTHPARIRDDQGALREEGLRALDQLLAAAREHAVRLILVLTNNWSDFGGAPAVLKMVAPRETLAKNAFWTDPRAIAAQLAYQRALATRVNTISRVRYCEDPTIMAWELANEPRGEPRMLARWARCMADGLRDAGVEQLIAWGGSGEDLRVIAAEGGVDILTLHMYGSELRTWPRRSLEARAIAWGETTLRARSAIARQAGLPLLLEEANWKSRRHAAHTREADAERACVLGAWLELAHTLGIGTLPWMIGERARADYDGYLIEADHAHTLDVLRRP